MSTEDKVLLEHAIAARRNAYAVYSGYFVGAAILDEHGEIFSGCNVENASYPVGTCAETNAIGAMIAAGSQRIVRIAIAGGRAELQKCLPCGACRQCIAEFADANTDIIVRDGTGQVQHYSIEDLLPESFKLEPGGN